MSEQKITGIDLAKTNFYLFSINAHGKPAGKIKLSHNQLFSQPSQQIAFQHYCQSLEQIEDRILQLGHEISRLLPEWSLCNLVCQLQALKGIGQLIAITQVFLPELGEH